MLTPEQQALIFLAQEIDDINNWRNGNKNYDLQRYAEDHVKSILGVTDHDHEQA